jgi:hypothetical protein
LNLPFANWATAPPDTTVIVGGDQFELSQAVEFSVLDWRSERIRILAKSRISLV